MFKLTYVQTFYKVALLYIFYFKFVGANYFPCLFVPKENLSEKQELTLT